MWFVLGFFAAAFFGMTSFIFVLEGYRKVAGLAFLLCAVACAVSMVSVMASSS